MQHEWKDSRELEDNSELMERLISIRDGVKKIVEGLKQSEELLAIQKEQLLKEEEENK